MPRGRSIVPTLAVLVVLIGFSFSAAEPPADPPQVLRNPELGPPVTPYVFEGDVRDLPRPRAWQPGDPIREIPIRFYAPPGKRPQVVDKLGLDPLLQPPLPSFSELQSTTDPAATSGLTIGTFTTPTRNFDGIDFSGAWPPDPVGDVGPEHYIQMTNVHSDLYGSLVRIFDKAEPVPNELATFSQSSLAKGPCRNGLGDPIVLYDRQADRWLLSEFAGPAYLCVSISRTGDPVGGGWYAYTFETPVFPDYPKYAVWATDANGGAGSYVVGTNAAAADATYEGPGIYALNRSAMLAGESASFVRFNVPWLTGLHVQSLIPADPDGPLGPPTGEPAVIMRHRDTEIHVGPDAPADLLDMWLLDVDWQEPLNTILTTTAGIDVTEFDSTLCGTAFGGCFPQPDTTVVLHPLKEALMHRLQYYNHGEFETLVGNFTVDVDGQDHGGIRWFELRRPTGGAWTVHQEGTYSPDEHHRWMGSIAMDQAGDIALGYSIASSSLYPGLRYAGRLADDAPGWMTQPETAIHSGTSSSPIDRWGDYHAMSLDPEDDCTFWFTGMDMNADATWRTQIVSFRSDTCGCADVPPLPSLEAEVNADNRIDLFWDDSAEETVVEYLVQRSRRAGGPYELLAVVPDGSSGVAGGPGYAFEDTDVQGGIAYYYVVVARDDRGCRSRPFNEVVATATGACTLAPVFAGLGSATSANLETCAVDLAWEAAVPECGGPAVYDVYRSDVPGFAPGPENLLMSGVAETAARDFDALVTATPYYYVVRAVDLANGVGEQNLIERQAIPAGPNSGEHGMLFEDFEASDSFDAWTVLIGPGPHDCGEWARVQDWYELDYQALAANDTCNGWTSSSMDSPAIDLDVQGIQTVAVEAFCWYSAGNGGDSATVEAWNGSAWEIVLAFPNTRSFYGLQSIDVTAQAAGNPAFRVRFNYQNARHDELFSVDDVEVVANVYNTCTTQPEE